MDPREAVFYSLAEKRYPIMEMNMSKLSLEDIFLEMTKTEETAQEAAPEKEEA